MLDDIILWFRTDFFNFLARNLAVILVVGISLLFLTPTPQEAKTMAMLLRAETMAIFLSGLFAFAFTKINFTRLETFAQDYSRVLSSIVLGVHILVGLYYLAVYIAQF